MTSELEKRKALSGFFDELDKMASLAAAARFGVGVLLGSMLWSRLGADEKKELEQKSRQMTGERQMPPIFIAVTGPQQSVVERELRKPDPDLRLGNLFAHPRDLELRDMYKGAAEMGTPQFVPEEDKSKSMQLLNRSQKVGMFGTKKPPEPNVRAVATRV